ncbi:DUF3022 domain-containing protein (plasmid) [Pararobbsia alpina]
MSGASDWLAFVLRSDFPVDARFSETGESDTVDVSWFVDGTSARPHPGRPVRIILDNMVVTRWAEASEPDQDFIASRIRALVAYTRLMHGGEIDRRRMFAPLVVRCDLVDVWLFAEYQSVSGGGIGRRV